MSSPWKPSVQITHIGTATAILSIDDINFITDPFFSTTGSSFDVGTEKPLKVLDNPALGLQDLPVIDAVLLSHENHPDNLDNLGRRLLDGRRVFTTVDGAKNLAPRPAVHGLKPWESVEVKIAGKVYKHPKSRFSQRVLLNQPRSPSKSPLLPQSTSQATKPWV
jgi:L-ascorbate metabolism protein UlaG (beta-lactamase superfamily)